MPMLKMCLMRGCPAYATDRGYCDEHKGTADIKAAQKSSYKNRQADRYKQRQAIYQTTEWRKASATCKHNADNTCAKCGWHSVDGRGLVADHIIPVLEVDDPYDQANLQCLCRSCSGKKDAKRSSSHRGEGFSA